MALSTEQKQTLREAEAVYQSLAQDGSINFSDPDDVMAFLKPRLAGEEREHFDILFLDIKHNLIAVERMFSGTIDQTTIFVREIAKKGLELNCSKVVLSHNHPSGNVRPSNSDLKMTKQVSEALDIFKIKVLDHIIVGFSGETLSFARDNYL